MAQVPALALVGSAEFFCRTFHPTECLGQVPALLFPVFQQNLLNLQDGDDYEAAAAADPFSSVHLHYTPPSCNASSPQQQQQHFFLLHVDVAKLTSFCPLLGRLVLCEPRAADIIFSVALWRIAAASFQMSTAQADSEIAAAASTTVLNPVAAATPSSSSAPAALSPYDVSKFVAHLVPSRRPFQESCGPVVANKSSSSSSVLDILLQLSQAATCERVSLAEYIEQQQQQQESDASAFQAEPLSLRSQVLDSVQQRMLAVINVNVPLGAMSSVLDQNIDPREVERLVLPPQTQQQSKQQQQQQDDSAATTLPTLSGRYFFCSAGEFVGSPLLTHGRVSPLIHLVGVVTRTFHIRRPGNAVDVLPVIKVQQLLRDSGGSFDFSTNADIDVVFPLLPPNSSSSSSSLNQDEGDGVSSSSNPLQEIDFTLLAPGRVVDIAGRIALFDLQIVFQQQQRQQRDASAGATTPVIFALSCTAATASSPVAPPLPAASILPFHQLLQNFSSDPQAVENDLYSTLKLHLCVLIGEVFRDSDKQQQQQQQKSSSSSSFSSHQGLFQLSSLLAAVPPTAWLSILLAATVATSSMATSLSESEEEQQHKIPCASASFRTTLFAPVGHAKLLFSLLESTATLGAGARQLIAVADCSPAGSCGGGPTGCLFMSGARGGAAGGSAGGGGGGGGGLPVLPLRNYTKPVTGNGAVESRCAGQMERAVGCAFVVPDLTALNKEQLAQLLRGDGSRVGGGGAMPSSSNNNSFLLPAHHNGSGGETPQFFPSTPSFFPTTTTTTTTPQQAGGGAFLAMAGAAHHQSSSNPNNYAITSSFQIPDLPQNAQHFQLLTPQQHQLTNLFGQEDDLSAVLALDDKGGDYQNDDFFFPQQQQQQQQGLAPALFSSINTRQSSVTTNSASASSSSSLRRAPPPPPLPQSLVSFASICNTSSSRQQQHNMARFAERCDTTAFVAASEDSIVAEDAWAECFMSHLSVQQQNPEVEQARQSLLCSIRDCVEMEQQRCECLSAPGSQKLNIQLALSVAQRFLLQSTSSSNGSNNSNDDDDDDAEQQQNNQQLLRFFSPEAVALLRRYIQVARRALAALHAGFETSVIRVAVLHAAAFQSPLCTFSDAVVAVCAVDASLRAVLGESVFSSSSAAASGRQANLLDVVGNLLVAGPNMEEDAPTPSSLPDLVLHSVLFSGTISSVVGSMMQALG